MKRLAGIFAVLAIAFAIWGGWLLLRPGPPDVTYIPPPVEDMLRPPGQRGPFGLERLPEPDAYRPQHDARAITSPIRRILVEKSARRMTIWQQDGPTQTYRIALGFSPDGPKARQGDGRTPEGIFRIDRLNDQSRFHLSLGLDYPQPHHREAARRAGVSPGGDIMIHGQPNSIARGYRVKGDWTEGCIAVDNHEIEEIFAMARIGTEVEIRP